MDAPRSGWILGLSLSLLMHLALLLTPAALLSRLLPPWEELAPPIELKAELRPQPGPAAAAKKASPRRTPRQAQPAAVPVAGVGSDETAMAASAEPVPREAETGAVPAPEPARAEPATPVSTDVALPRRGRIQFAINRGDRGFVVGRAVHTWHADAGRYEITNVSETTGLAALFRPVRMLQSSTGELAGVDLLPREYRAGRDDKLIDVASFDREAGQLRYAAGRVAPLLAGEQDLLSAFYQLGRRPIAEAVELTVTTGRKIERYRFVVVGEEKLLLRGDEVRTVHLLSGGEPGQDATEVWLAPSLHGLPLKIRYTDRNGDAYEQVAEELVFDEDDAAGGKP